MQKWISIFTYWSKSAIWDYELIHLTLFDVWWDSSLVWGDYWLGLYTQSNGLSNTSCNIPKVKCHSRSSCKQIRFYNWVHPMLFQNDSLEGDIQIREMLRHNCRKKPCFRVGVIFQWILRAVPILVSSIPLFFPLFCKWFRVFPFTHLDTVWLSMNESFTSRA